jgi:hypothetical protein
MNMQRQQTLGPPLDGGYPIDSDFQQLTDDGCPLTPDPSLWGAEDWRDNFGEWDTFANNPADGPDGVTSARKVP